MRIAPVFLLAATFASTLSAQRPLRAAPAGAAGASVLQTVTFDIAGAFQERYRATTEALVFGRFSIGLSGEYTTHAENQDVYYPSPVMGCPIEMLCASDVGLPNGPRYRAWSFNVHGRWYPRVLSFDGVRQSASIYVGEFVGYHERRATTFAYGCPYCEVQPADSVTLAPDSTVVYPPVPYPYPGGISFTQKLHGWEPGAEFGIRIKPARHVVIDMGGTFRLETLQDPQSAVRPGGVIKQLTVAVGVGW